MSEIYKIKFSIILCLMLLSNMMLYVVVTQASAYECQGEVFINVNGSGKFAEYKLSECNLVKTANGKISRFEKDGRTYENSWTEEFKKLYYDNHIYRYNMEERLAGFFSQYDLEKLQKIQVHFRRHTLFGEGQDPSTDNIYLTGPGRKPKYFIDYTYDFYPNKQFSHVVYRYIGSALINLETKKVTFPFGIDDIKHIDWSSNGQLVAYSFQGYTAKIPGNKPYSETLDQDQATLVIMDILNEKTLFKKNMGKKYIEDLAWSPDTSHIGLISSSIRLGLLPWEILAWLGGHSGGVYKTFFIEIYDTNGNAVFIKEIEGDYRDGSARIMWH